MTVDAFDGRALAPSTYRTLPMEKRLDLHADRAFLSGLLDESWHDHR